VPGASEVRELLPGLLLPVIHSFRMVYPRPVIPLREGRGLEYHSKFNWMPKLRFHRVARGVRRRQVLGVMTTPFDSGLCHSW
jgi:hypothetical protein